MGLQITSLIADAYTMWHCKFPHILHNFTRTVAYHLFLEGVARKHFEGFFLCDNEPFELLFLLNDVGGDRVDCIIYDSWMQGTVIETECFENDFEDGRIVPYQ